MVLVLLFHVVDNTVGQRLWHLPGTGPFIANAGPTLTLFFALSGFVLTLGWREGTSARGFYVRRFARIYPLYFVAWVCAVAVTWARDDNLPAWNVALATLLLVQSTIPSETYQFGVDLVFWSLSCEALFYASLPFLLPKLRKLTTRQLMYAIGLCWAWMALWPLVIGQLAGGSGWRVMTQSPFYRGAEFLAGVLACLLVMRGWRAPMSQRVWSFVAIVSFVLSSLLVRELHQRGLNMNGARLIGIVLAVPVVLVLIVSLAEADLEGIRGRFTGRTWVSLGDWTYPIYLFHFPLLLALHPPFTRNDSWGGLGQLAIYMALITGLAAVLHLRFLKPVERAIKRRWERPAGATPSPVGIHPAAPGP
jgi:peptidoglycan/LPS O-acetylase OafA/YrhL